MSSINIIKIDNNIEFQKYKYGDCVLELTDKIDDTVIRYNNRYYYFPIKVLSMIHNLYVGEFSNSINTLKGIIYHDDKLPNKYIHNYYYLHDEYSIIDIKWYEEYALKNKYSVCEYYFDNKYDELMFADKKIDVMYLLHMIAPINIKNNLKCKKKITLVEMSKNTEDDFLGVMYLENRVFGDEYSKKNAIRYYEVVIDNDNPKIKYYYAYHGSIVVGFISVMVVDNILKVEDFCVLKLYQHQGYGESIFKHILEEYNYCDFISLVAEGDDTPCEMYYKWGFKKFGESYLVRIVK